MKELLKKIDIVYLIGLLLCFMGIYFERTVFIDGDFFYGLSLLITPTIASYLPYVGLLVILVEFLLSKHYKPLYEKLVMDKSNRSILIFLVVSTILFLLTLLLPFNIGYWLFSGLSIGLLIYIIIVRKTKFHYVTLVFYLLVLLESFLYLTGNKSNENLYNLVFNYALAFYILCFLVSLILFITKKIKRNNTVPLEVFSVFTFFYLMYWYVHNKIFELKYLSSEYSSYLPMDVLNNQFLFGGLCPDGTEPYTNTFYGAVQISCEYVDQGVILLRSSGYLHLVFANAMIILLLFLVNYFSKKRVD